MQVLNKLQIKSIELEKKKTFKVLILECKCKKTILGLTLAEWIKFASSHLTSEIIKFDDKSNLLEFVSSYLDDSFDYTIVLLSKTPLITSETLKNIQEYAVMKDISLCKLPLGYVINNKKSSENIDSLYSQNIDEFYIVESKVQLNFALKVLQERINNFHVDNGVDLISPNSVYIEPFVDIASDVVIYPHNTLKGKTVIGKNVILKENNVIDNSKIGDNSCISGSVINNSAVASNVYISSFCEINNSLIGEDTVIEKGASINNYHVDMKSKIKPNTILGDTNDSNSGAR